MPNPTMAAATSPLPDARSLGHRGMAGLIVAVVFLGAATHARAQDTTTFHASVRALVDAAGEIVEVESIAENLHPTLARAAEDFVRTLRFATPVRDGRAVGGQTFVNLGGCLVQGGGEARLAFRYLDTGPQVRTLARDSGVRRLMETWISSGGARLEATVTADVGTDGGVTPVEVSYTVAPRDRRRMDTALQQMVRQMHYHTEQIDGMPIATRVKVPVTMTMESDAGPRSSRARAAAEAASAVRNEQACLAAAMGDSTRAVAVDSPFRLLASTE